MPEKNFRLDDKKFRFLIENSFEVVLLVDLKARILYATPSTVKMFGRSFDEFMGIKGVKFVHPKDIPVVVKALAKIALKPKASVTVEFRVQHKEGYYKWVEATGTNLLSEPGINAVVVNLHDITARKELEERKNDFISMAGHELKTPLTTLRLYSQTLIKKIKDEKNKDMVTKIDFQVNQMIRLVSDLLDTTKIQQNKLPLEMERFPLLEAIQEAAEGIAQAHPHYPIKIRCIYNGKVIADRFRIHQVVTNLLTNAIKFSPAGKNIVITISESGKYAVVSVKDQGEGISKTSQKKLFDRFFQANLHDSAKGLGLGLFISHNIVKKHGGELSVKSDKGKGATFSFTLLKK